eukprot:NODE_4046_length_334_cov_61.964912_g3964_i0.p1 GENE.NODE_4046_length_334_cov_61.964912_g3964_i0~~NODE_4046_length_334_cov_61.964912_g3964_i0.p1  ORF type:complete len:52 (+),score=3.55 NODE_4046_length_334_cov_61.964912_g3964_i0:105-260(+)
MSIDQHVPGKHTDYKYSNQRRNLVNPVKTPTEAIKCLAVDETTRENTSGYF